MTCMRSYPLTRCPGCRKAFRAEIGIPAEELAGLFFVACPYCGLKFDRFDLSPAERPPNQEAA